MSRSTSEDLVTMVSGCEHSDNTSSTARVSLRSRSIG